MGRLIGGQDINFEVESLNSTVQALDFEVESLNSTVQALDFKINHYSRSQNPPDNPSIGDWWDEIDSSTKLIQAWEWQGVYWQSRDRYYLEINSSLGTTATAVTNSMGTIKYLDFTQYDIYFESLKGLYWIGTSQSVTRYWYFVVALLTGSVAAGITVIDNNNFNTISSQNTALRYLINIPINLSFDSTALNLRGVSLSAIRSGATSSLTFAAYLYYRLIRKNV